MYTNYIILYITVNRFYQEIYCNNDLSTIFRTRFLIIIILLLKARFTIKPRRKQGSNVVEPLVSVVSARASRNLSSRPRLTRNLSCSLWNISGKMKGRFTVSRRGTVFECIWIIQPRRGGELGCNNRFSGRFIASDRTSLATAPLYKTLLNTARRKSPIISTWNQL